MAYIVKRTWTATLTDGTKKRHRSDVYSIRYLDNGRRRWAKGYTDLGATKQKAAKLEAALARGEQGLVDPHRASMTRPIGEHVTAYIADLLASGRDDKYIANIKHRLSLIFASCKWKTLRDMNAAAFAAWRSRAKAEPRKGTRIAGEKTTAAASTLNQYLESVRAFTNWCAQHGHMPGVPISGGRMMSIVFSGVGRVDGPEVRQRRALTDQQVAMLLAVSPPDRALAYRLALAVGLRRAELEDLQWGDLRVNAIKPYVALRSEATKARRGDRISLPQSLAAAFREVKPEKAKDNDRVFTLVAPIKLWKTDLKAAGIPYLDDQGRQLDFHGGTRKTLNTRMQRHGIPLAIAMRTMRHTDARLTMRDYVDDEALGMSEDTAVLPEIAPSTGLLDHDALNDDQGIRKGTE